MSGLEKILRTVRRAVAITAISLATANNVSCPETNKNIEPWMLETFAPGESFVDKQLKYEEMLGIEDVDTARIYWDSVINTLRSEIEKAYDKEHFDKENARKVANIISSFLSRERYDSDSNKSVVLTEALKTRKCDCGRFVTIFYSIGQECELPIRFTHIPGHVFIRWVLPDSTYINWEAQPQWKKKEKEDSYYISRDTINLKSVKTGVYLRTLGDREALGLLHERISAIILRNLENPLRTDSNITDSIKKCELYKLEQLQKTHSMRALYFDDRNINATFALACVNYNLKEIPEAYNNLLRTLELDSTHWRAKRMIKLLEKRGYPPKDTNYFPPRPQEEWFYNNRTYTKDTGNYIYRP